jgi:hypothetical protein
MKRTLLFAYGLGAVLFCTACQTIVGIRERTSEITDECVEYCDNAVNRCKEHGFLPYQDTPHCEAICAKLDSAESPAGSLTLACLKQQTGSFHEPLECRLARPGGGSTCGDECQAYCDLHFSICDELPVGSNIGECLDFCSDLVVGNDLDAKKAFDGADTLQCRLAHLSTAAAEDVANRPKERIKHCGHARGDLSGKLCVDKKPNCAQYCKIVMKACTGASQQYANEAQCKVMCENVPEVTEPVDRLATSIECRLQNAYTALLTPSAERCQLAGPAGGGMGEKCGSECRGYCEHLSSACDGFGFEAFGQDRNSALVMCTNECNTRGLARARDDLSCRLENIAEALLKPSDSAARCDSAFGRGACALASVSP